MARPVLLCLSSVYKGQAFLSAAAVAGADVVLLTTDSLRDAAWPREALKDIFTVPERARPDQFLCTAYRIARHAPVARVVGLDEADLEIAALVREELRVPGMGQSTTRFFRDKLAMRTRARQSGLPQPRFIGVIQHEAIREWMQQVPGPWLLKPRVGGDETGILRIDEPRELWHILEEMGDRQSGFLLEEFLPGAVFHVDSIVWEQSVLLESLSAYGRPPMQVLAEGGVFSTRTIDAKGRIAADLRLANAALLQSLGMVTGTTHAEFILAQDGRLRVLSCAARIVGAHIAEVMETAHGVHPWKEWAAMEVAAASGRTYHLPLLRKQRHAASILCGTHEGEPDLTAFNAPEVAARFRGDHRAAIILQAETPEQIDALTRTYAERFARAFAAS